MVAYLIIHVLISISVMAVVIKYIQIMSTYSKSRYLCMATQTYKILCMNCQLSNLAAAQHIPLSHPYFGAIVSFTKHSSILGQDE